MELLEYITLNCPYCGKKSELTIERNDSDQSYIEDCQVCCRAMKLEVIMNGDDIDVSVSREEDV